MAKLRNNSFTTNMSIRPNMKVSESTHKCLQNFLTFAQIMGVFPISSLREENPGKLQFKLCSWKIVYTVLLSTMYLISTCLSFYKAVTQGILLNQLISPLFYFNSFCTSIIFIRLSSQWPRFIVLWTRMEEQLIKKYKNPPNLYRKVNIASFIMITIAFIEHSLAIANSIYSKNCWNNSTGWEHHFRKQSHFIFRYFPYNFYVGLIFMILSWFAAFVWNFGDIFIILISFIMSSRFRQITKKIKVITDELRKTREPVITSAKVYKDISMQKAELTFWRDIREDYDKVCQIVRYLDDLLSNLVLLSYACNLTFILVQLFNSLKNMPTAIEGVYFFYSFGLVISRIVVVSIFGASVNEESQEPLPLLHSLPTDLYNEEIQRLITQVHVDSAALTGYNFFRITKGLVLSVAAAIITYELVLIQFNQTALEKYMNSNSSVCY